MNRLALALTLALCANACVQTDDTGPDGPTGPVASPEHASDASADVRPDALGAGGWSTGGPCVLGSTLIINPPTPHE